MATEIECGPIQLELIVEMLAQNKEKNRISLDIFTKALDQFKCRCLDSIVRL